MKKILTASLVAMMAVTAANANIASTKYVDDRTGTATFTADSIKNSANLTAAVETLAGTVATNNTNVTQAINDAKTEITNAYEAADTALDGKITAEKEAREAADTALDGKITALDTETTNALALKEDVANKATTEYTEGSTTQYPSIKIAEVIANTAVASTKTDLSTLTATVAANKAELQGELDTAVGNLQKADTDNLQAAKDYADSKDAAQTTTLQGEIATAKSGAESTAKAYTDTEIAKIDTAYKAADTELQGAIDAINNAESGILADAKKYADDQDAAQTATLQGEIATAKSGAESTAKAYTDTEIAKIDTAYKAADAGLQEQITANKTAIEANDVDIKALQDKDATLTALASFPVACATGDSDCALVIREGTMKWEKVEY